MRRLLIAISLTLSIAALMALRSGAVGALSTTRSSSASDSANSREPIYYEHVVRENPPMHLHILTIDLTDPRVRVRVCPGGADPDGPAGPWQTTLKSVRDIAEENHLEAAVNGSFFMCKDARTFAGHSIPYFAGNWATVAGWAMSDGKMLSTPDAGGCSLVVDSAGAVRIADFRPKLPANAREVVSGPELILTSGKITTTTIDRAPRTAVGIDRAGKKLIMLVVDGRATDYSAGMGTVEMAEVLRDHGCWNGLMLDGGGSSTMVMRDPIEDVARVLNRPSDGHDLPIAMSLERPVACALGVQLVSTTEPSVQK